MTNQSIKDILIEKGVEHLFHANSVLTACTFIENNGLLSRGTVDELGLCQTLQYTDKSDKALDVYHDIFFDSVDVHLRASNVNHYGPVLFVYSIDVLDTLPPDCVRITIRNPCYWDSDMQEHQRYFLTDDELNFSFFPGDFNQHITLRHQSIPLSFDYLERIIIDDPGLEDNRHFTMAVHHLQNLIDRHINGTPLEIRQCPHYCKCKEKYSNSSPGYTYHRFKIR